MAVPLILAGAGMVVRAVAPRVIQQLMRQGFKRATTQQIKKAGGEKGMSTVTSVSQAKNLKPTRPSLRPSTKVVKPKSGVTSQQRSALSNMGGRTVAPKKPSSTSVAAKPRSNVTTSRTTSVAPRRTTSVTAPKSRPTMRNITPPKRSLPSAPPKRPISNAQRAANIGKTAAALGTAASMLPSIKEGPKTAKAKPSVTGPMPRPSRNAPNYGMPKPKAKPSEGKDPRGNQIKPTPGKTIMPKKFDGGYNTKTQRLVNITIDGKKATYEIPKGMTTKQAKSLLTGTVKKKEGGTPGKYKGFSKLPEKVQKKMNPTLAAKYEVGGYLNTKQKARLDRLASEGKINFPSKTTKPKPKAKPKKPDGRRQYPIKPTTRKPKPIQFKGGGSINSGKVARQVRGFGAARKPKK